NNIFIAATDGTRESVTSARSARLETQGGERMALLTDGQRLETTRDKPGVKISAFSEYGTRIGSAPAGSAEELSVKTRATHELVMQPLPAYRAELGWRIGLALAALNFVVLGLAVASVNPRAARSTSLVFALFAFIVYYNLMTLGQSWVGAGRLGLVSFMVLLHGGMLLLSLLVLAVRHNQWTIRRLWQPKPQPGSAT
ncbi:MAG: LptF/LptG family permease, partial [Comamonadaceae bacterium]